jgi:hypothetical protein
MLKRLLTAACLCVLLTSPALGQDAEPKTYRLAETFSPGERWMLASIMIDQTVDVTMEEASQVMDQVINQMMVMKMVISEPDENGAKTATLTYERIVQQMNLGDMTGMKQFYDSANPDPASPLTPQMKPLTDLRFTITIDKNNKIAAVKGFDELVAKMQEKNPQAAGMLAQMKDSFGDEQIKNLFQQGMEAMPEKPLAVGQTWKQSIPLPVAMIGDVTINAEYELAEVKDVDGRQIGTINIDSSGELAKQAAAGGPGGMTFEKFDIKQEGTMTYDFQKGRLSHSEIKQTGDMGGSMMGGTMQIDQFLTISQRISDGRDRDAENKIVEKLKEAHAGPAADAPPAGNDDPPANDF